MANLQGEELDYQLGKVTVTWVDQGDGTYAKQVSDGTTGRIQNFDYDTTDPNKPLMTYEGIALAGTVGSAASWRIKKYSYSGSNLISVRFADGDTKFDNVWDNRAALSYS